MAEPSAEVREVARAIYEANYSGFEALPNRRTAPVWEAASDNVKAFVFRQASAAILRLDSIRANRRA